MVSWSTINNIFSFSFFISQIESIRSRQVFGSFHEFQNIDSTSIKYNIPPNPHLQSFFTRRYNLISGSMLLKCL